MAHRVCPPWVGYFLLNPFRKLFENPETILGPLVQDGMTVLEPGCGMGYFTLPLARMVGPRGRVAAAEVQEKMLDVLARRLKKARLSGRVEFVRLHEKKPHFRDFVDQVDLTVAIHMVHEVPDQGVFFKAVWEALKPGGKLYVLEPKGHISQKEFEKTVAAAMSVGFRPRDLEGKRPVREKLLIKE